MAKATPILLQPFIGKVISATTATINGNIIRGGEITAIEAMNGNNVRVWYRAGDSKQFMIISYAQFTEILANGRTDSDFISYCIY